MPITRISALQMTSRSSVEDNLQTAKKLLEQAHQDRSRLAVLPEMFALMGTDNATQLAIREPLGQGPIQDFLSQQAKRLGIWIVGGTIPIAITHSHKMRAACLVFDDEGRRVARYDKMHMYDASINNRQEHYRESERVEAGEEHLVVDTPCGKLGLAVCYDLRFPELFTLMLKQGAQIFAVPTAFTVPTGEAHWEALTRCRAIENFSYLIAACQTGTHDNARKTFGHSMIIDPWGKVLQCLPQNEGVITAEIDLDYLQEVRSRMTAIELRLKK